MQVHTHDPLVEFPEKNLIAKFVDAKNAFWLNSFKREKILGPLQQFRHDVGLLWPGADVLISPARGKGRRLPYTLELVRPGDMWVGVKTLTPNRKLQRPGDYPSFPSCHSTPSTKAKQGRYPAPSCPLDRNCRDNPGLGEERQARGRRGGVFSGRGNTKRPKTFTGSHGAGAEVAGSHAFT